MNPLATSTEVEAFVRAAESFRSLLDRRRAFEDVTAFTELAQSLAVLYAASLALPVVHLSDDDETSDAPPPDVVVPEVVVLGEVDVYWEFFNPYVEDSVVGASLTDDIKDVYRDVVGGLLLFQRGEVEDAIWNWRFFRQNHWGDHAVDALRALQRLITKGERET